MAKILLSMNEDVLRAIDRAAKAGGRSRSAYIAERARRDAMLVGRRRAALARHARKRLDRLFANAPATEATADIRAERDAR